MKFQTCSVHHGDSFEEISWLAVALTKPEAELLRLESAFWTPECCGSRIVPDACGRLACCCGVPRVY